MHLQQLTSRTVNASANIVFQSANLSAGFPIGNTITSPTSSGVIDSRTIGDWYQVKTNEVKTYYIASLILELGIMIQQIIHKVLSQLQTLVSFWLKNNEMVRINQLVAGTKFWNIN